MKDYEKIKLNVSGYFKQPNDVLAADYANKQKYELLKQWEYDLREMQVAEEENMIGTVSDVTLDDVLKALQALDYDAKEECNVGANKQGM